MKIWNSYGSEHSMNLVIIGQFKEVHEAEEFETLINSLTEFLMGNSKFDVEQDRYDEKTLEFLVKKNLSILSPQEIGHFLYDKSITRNGNEITLGSEDFISGFVNLLIYKGAKVEVFSAHDYPTNEKE